LLSKGKSISVVLLLQVAAWILSGQGWYEVSMAPDGESLVLQTFDGFTSYSFISALLLVALAGTAVAMLSGKLTRTVALVFSAFAGVFLAVLGITSVLSTNLAGITNQIESATGIAATHGLSGVETNTLFYAYLAIATFVALALTTLAAAWFSRNWVNRLSSPQKNRSRSKLTDPISLWDEQR
jgi:hypothetical protein